MRAQTEIDAEIAKLKEMKPRVRQFSIFNDDNHAAIDRQVHVLSTDIDDDDALELEGADYEAYQWKIGEENEPPSEGWAALVK